MLEWKVRRKLKVEKWRKGKRTITALEIGWIEMMLFISLFMIWQALFSSKSVLQYVLWQTNIDNPTEVASKTVIELKARNQGRIGILILTPCYQRKEVAEQWRRLEQWGCCSDPSVND